MIEVLPGIITGIFLLVILSYYGLLFLPTHKPKKECTFSSITVIIPAHNEERYLGACILSVLAADFKGKKELVVVDDGSSDSTTHVANSFGKKIKLISIPHSGKSQAINTALFKSRSDLIAVVDGDSVIHADALSAVAEEVSRKNVVAASCVITVKNRVGIGLWLHIEQLYNSLMRHLLSKVNANIVTPGPLSVYRRKELVSIGGFSTEGFSEDVDVTIRLIRKGYRIGLSEKAKAETNMPLDPRGFLRQRTRFSRGMLNIFKKHLRVNTAWIDIYTLPLLVFGYIQAVIMGSFTLYQMISGYIQYFASQGMYFNASVLKFFFEWFSVVGTGRWILSVFSGSTPLTFVTIFGILSTLLSYPLYLIAIFKYDRGFRLGHLLPLFFMFPFWLLVMMIYILMLPEVLSNKQRNIWKKNE